MVLDEIDIKILKENFDEELLKQINSDNVALLYNYLEQQGMEDINDFFVSNADLFLLDYDTFVEKFEKLKKKLGNDYKEKLEEDCSLIEIMYE